MKFSNKTEMLLKEVKTNLEKKDFKIDEVLNKASEGEYLSTNEISCLINFGAIITLRELPEHSAATLRYTFYPIILACSRLSEK